MNRSNFPESDPVGRAALGLPRRRSSDLNRLLRSPSSDDDAVRGLRERQLWLWRHPAGLQLEVPYGYGYSPYYGGDRGEHHNSGTVSAWHGRCFAPRYGGGFGAWRGWWPP